MPTKAYGNLVVNVLHNRNKRSKPNRPFANGRPDGTTLHETSNLFAGARANAAYYASPRNAPPSVTFFVDHKEWWESLPLTEQTWSAGDGRGGCDVHLAALEVCVDDDPVGAWRNAIRGVRELRHGGYIGDQVNFHHDCSGKWCPALLLQHPEVYRPIVSRSPSGRIRDPQGRTNRVIAQLRADQLDEAGLTEQSVLAAIRAPYPAENAPEAAPVGAQRPEIAQALASIDDGVSALRKALT